jgi:hypothetical protein
MQGDGNLVLYQDGWGPLWSTQTNGKDGGRAAIMQTNGNFQVFTPQSIAIWHSDTGGHDGAWVTVQDDGNLVIYQSGCTGANHSCWASNTKGH